MLVLRTIADTDIPMIQGWLNEEHVKQWFDPASDWLEAINGRNGEYSFISHFIVLQGEEPIGFCQYYDCSKTGDGYKWANEPAGTFGIDYMIGKKELLGKGIGRELIGMICNMAMENGAKWVVADPSGKAGKENVRSIRGLMANGFQLDSATGLYKKAAI